MKVLTAAVLLLVITLRAAAQGGSADAGRDEFYRFSHELFERAAPPEVRLLYQFPARDEWDFHVGRLERALSGGSLPELAALATEARPALATLRMVPGAEEIADWLEQRVDAMEAAAQAVTPPAPSDPKAPRNITVQPVPHYNLWLGRVRGRPLPVLAPRLMPRLQAVFRAEGIPPELTWIAEAESSLNPSARSPAGARGLFQFMPATARSLGLSTFPPDQRTDPERSARAAAAYLRTLHGRFRNWALVLAAYNAGEGRVGRTLQERRADTFTAIADFLPAETRMYVPKVCALIATRAGVTLDRIPPPR
jgi:membrane-bound lytic murein transglycosylase D